MGKNRVMFWWVGGLGLLVAGLAALGFWRSQVVVWQADSKIAPLVSLLKSDNDAVAEKAGFWPWEAADLRLSWLDPWSTSGAELVIRPEIPRTGTWAAFEVLGLQTQAETPVVKDWAAWLADLDRKDPAVVPLAVSAKSDAELATLLVWVTEALWGPQAVETAFKEGDWNKAVATLQEWAAQGRLAPNWWDYTDLDVANAVAEGRARYGLTWSGLHFPRTAGGIQKQSFRVPPPSPGRLNFSLVGRWLVLDEGGGWGSASLVHAHAQALFSVPASQLWLKEGGLLLADSNLPAVNQESKALAFARLAAATWIAAPPSGADMTRWKTLFDTIRTELRK